MKVRVVEEVWAQDDGGVKIVERRYWTGEQSPPCEWFPNGLVVIGGCPDYIVRDELDPDASVTVSIGNDDVE